MRAYLILENGKVFEGEGIGSCRDSVAEVVFNTSMTGYEQVLTDASYAGQAVCMTYPLIGNYGENPEDMEGRVPNVEGFLVHELSPVASNFRNKGSIGDFLEKYDIPGIQGIDTRALTRIIREHGTMNGLITRKSDLDMDEVQKKLAAYRVGDVVSRVTCKEAYTKEADPEKKTGLKVALIDLGLKQSIVKSLTKRGVDVTVYPAETKAEEILAAKPDGIMLSNGPGDPIDCRNVIKEAKKLYDSGTRIFAICLGHQIMALATGMETEKMHFGHRGGNHPVRDEKTGRVYVTSQNHGYVVKADSVNKDFAEPVFVNVNDGTIEGIHYKNRPVLTVQFHPEAAPGPADTGFLFDRFIEEMKQDKADSRQ